jgi:hypothetical protein
MKGFDHEEIEEVESYRERREYEDVMFELSGPEGARFQDLKVTAFCFPGGVWAVADSTRRDSIRFYVRVEAFLDERAPDRTWGMGRI